MYPKCAALMSTCLCDPRIQLNVFCGWTQRVCGQLTDHFQIARGFNKRCCVPPINVIWRDPFISRCCTCHYALWAAAYSLTYQRKSTYILNISFHNNMYPDIIMPVLARNLWQSHSRSAMKQRRGLWTDTCTECVWFASISIYATQTYISNGSTSETRRSLCVCHKHPTKTHPQKHWQTHAHICVHSISCDKVDALIGHHRAIEHNISK